VFDNLIESKAKRQRTLAQSITSLVVHGVLIFAAVKATQGVAEEIRTRPVDTTMVFLKPPEPPPPPPPPPPEDVIVSANPPPKGFQTIVNVVDIPKEIPPVDLNQKPFDPKDFTGKGVEGGIATGVVGGTGPVDVRSDVYMSSEIDDPASVVSVPPPRFPPAMQAAGIAGEVVLEFVVDQSGHAEPNTIKVIRSTNKMFEEPAREAVLKGVFKPGRNRGQPIRQLVRLPIVFKI
jgi:protein TonB